MDQEIDIQIFSHDCDRFCHKHLIIFSQKKGHIMNTYKKKSKPMNEDLLKDIKKEILKTYLYLVSRTTYDPKVIEIMKLSALALSHGLPRRPMEPRSPWRACMAR